MTLSQLEAIYKANIDLGHTEALQAVYTQGYCAGAGVTVSSSTPDQTSKQSAPATIVKLKGTNLR